ncbi:MAG: Asp-tRNA(Asn)/Glu-tRNA(Gln) amidotransferase subunit GatA [Oscillospiraceae bacterium]|jgi:aspartyl-tRNA(Asn)/glutamyl-tRNA(Gln) amidotransferase subunit A|nr:Asp-tRNA(Asn)/Glu-tRNA(Gln) amidotransferase subunit GatA [Oscillospiraceae bacterium]
MLNMSALKLSDAVRAKKLGVAEAVRAYLDKAAGNGHNAFLTVDGERALARAGAVQARLDAGELLSPLAGVPIALKDNITTAGVRTTCASKMLGGYVPVYNATVVEKLERAGLVVMGKLNMDEFAMGGSSETGAFGPVRNPWDVSRVAGGSSGGSAAAVAGGEIPIALGSDTGGSIRQPCSFCGVTGIKPTYGSVSRYGLIAYASSLDQIGPVGQSVEDCAALLSVISGPDEKDSTCVTGKAFDFGRDIPEKLDGFVIGLPRNYFGGGIDGAVRQAVLAAAEELEDAGGRVEEFEMPLMDYVIPAYYIIACAEASSNLSRYDGLKYGYRSASANTLSEVYRLSRSEGFGLEVKRRIMLGSFVLSSGYYDAYYKKALQTRALIKDAYDGLFKRFDMILSPVAPTTAYRLNENVDDPMKMYMGDIYTVSVNLAGLPAVSLPCGFDGKGLPVGFQLIGEAFSEKKLAAAAMAYQRRTDWHTKRPAGGEAV